MASQPAARDAAVPSAPQSFLLERSNLPRNLSAPVAHVIAVTAGNRSVRASSSHGWECPSLWPEMSGEIAELCAELTRLSSSVTMPKGAILFRCGDRVSGIFVIHRGVVRMSLDGADSVFPARKLGPGEIVGLPATLTGNYSLSAEVTEDAELGFVPAQRITDLFECSPRLCLTAMRLIGEEVARTRATLRDGIPHLPQN